ncbi:hypothetical protein [Azospirillum sp. sgz301742]
MRRLPILAVSALVLLATAPAQAGGYTCPNGATLRSNRTCSDGSMAVYKADEVKPYRSTDVKPRRSDAVRPAIPMGSGTIEKHQSREVKPFTKEERQRMLENDRRAGKELAGKIAPDGKLNQQQLNALSNQRCLQAAAVNPDVRCVPR